MMFSKRDCLKIVAGALLFLSGCTNLESPVEQVNKVQRVGKKTITTPASPKRTIAQTESSARFLCNKNKEIRVSYIKNNKKTKKLEKIKVTFSNTTHTLSPVVAKNGKKYTNIRWTWWESRSGKAYLMENPQKVLAENCVKQR